MSKNNRNVVEKYEYFCKIVEALFTINSEIGREINLAKSGKKAGKFICTLALLCSTEFIGGIIRNKFGIGEGKKNFEAGFKKLGTKYAEFLDENPNTYDIFRCGLAHEHYIKEPCYIYMKKRNTKEIGIVKDSNGEYYFIVEKYLEDFKKAFESLKVNVAGKTIYF